MAFSNVLDIPRYQPEENLSKLAAIQTSLEVFLPNSAYRFRFTIIGDSNLAISKTIFIRMLIDTDIYMEANQTKF